MEKKILNRDVIKMAAIITMLLNHISYVFLSSGTILRETLIVIGYFTAVTMCYFLVEGYEYTSCKTKYGKRLLLFALISEIPYWMVFQEKGIMTAAPLNMIFSLYWGFLFLETQTKMMPGMRKNSVILLLILISALSDWQIMALFFVIVFWQARIGQRTLKNAYLWSTIIYGVCHLGSSYQTMSPVMLAGTLAGGILMIGLSGFCILYLYNGKRAEKGANLLKWFFYVFYPAHLLILGIIHMCKG